MKDAVFLVVYLLAAFFGALKGTAEESARRGLAIIVVVFLFVFLAPVIGTYVIGSHRFGNLKQAGPEEDDDAAVLWVNSAAQEPLFVHLSDPHFVAKGRTETFQHMPRDAQSLRAFVERVLALKPRYLLVTGDVTDTGSESEWQQADEILFAPARQAGVAVVVAPGNHDLQPAFRGVRNAISPERAATILLRRVLEAGETARPDLRTVDGTSLTSLVAWRPTQEEVKTASDEFYWNCIRNGPADAESWSEGCRLASTPDVIRDSLVTFRTAPACNDWFPLVHTDAEARLAIFVLCSSAMPTITYGSNAVGSFGATQIPRLIKAIEGLPSSIRHVLILLHHPPVRRFRDDFGRPKNWLSWRAWNDSSIYNFALLGAEWRGAVDLMDGIVELRRRANSPSISLLFGHRHQRSHSSIRTEHWSVSLLEANAFGEAVGGRLGVRARYVTPDGTAIQAKWLRF